MGVAGMCPDVAFAIPGQGQLGDKSAKSRDKGMF